MIHFKTESSAMDQRLTFYKPESNNTIYDAIDVHPRSDNIKYKCWGCIIPQTGSLLNYRGDSFISETSHKITIRYVANKITDDMIIKIDGSTEEYEILYILDPYNKHEVLELFCVVKRRGAGY